MSEVSNFKTVPPTNLDPELINAPYVKELIHSDTGSAVRLDLDDKITVTTLTESLSRTGDRTITVKEYLEEDGGCDAAKKLNKITSSSGVSEHSPLGLTVSADVNALVARLTTNSKCSD